MNENIRAYVILIQQGKLTLEQVPEDLREQVTQALNNEVQGD